MRFLLIISGLLLFVSSCKENDMDAVRAEKDGFWGCNIIFAELVTNYDSLILANRAQLTLPANCNMEGKLFVQFVIDEKGNTGEFKIISRGLDNCPAVDSAAINVVKLLKFNPATDRDKPVATRRIIPVPFFKE